MAILPDVFNTEQATSNPFEPIDAGWYEAEIIKSELKTTKDGTGKYIALTFKIVGEEHTGRLMFSNLNIVNKSDIAVQIARSDLKAITKAIGFEGDLEDTQDLHNIPLMIKLSVKPETSQWPAKNEVKSYKGVELDDNSPF